MSRSPLRLSVHTTILPAMSGPAWPPISMHTGKTVGAAWAAAGASSAAAEAGQAAARLFVHVQIATQLDHDSMDAPVVAQVGQGHQGAGERAVKGDAGDGLPDSLRRRLVRPGGRVWRGAARPP